MEPATATSSSVTAVLGHVSRRACRTVGPASVPVDVDVVRRLRRQVVAVAVVLVVSWAVAYVAGPDASWVFVGQLVQVSGGLTAAVATARVARSSAGARRPLLLVTAAAALWSSAHLVHAFDQRGVPISGAVDVVVSTAGIIAHLLVIVAFLSIPGRARRARHTLDGLAIVGAVAVIAWSFGLRLDAINRGGADVITVDYPESPVIWVLLLGVAGYMASCTAGRWWGPVSTGAVAVLAHVVTDIAVWAQLEAGEYEPGGIADAGWLVGWLLFAVAVTVDWRTRPPASRGEAPATTLLPSIALGLAITVVVATALLVREVRGNPVLLGLAVGCFVIAIARSVNFQFDRIALTHALEAQAREARQQVERYEEALERTGAGVWEWDLGAGDVRLSRGLAWTVPGSLSTGDDSMLRFLGSIDESDREALVSAFERALAEESEIRLDRRIATATGEIRFIELRGSIRRRPTGDVTGVSGVSIDVTERRRAEERLAATAAQSVELAEFGRRTMRSQGMDSVVSDAADVVARVLGVDECSVVRFDSGGRRRRIALGAGNDGSVSARDRYVKVALRTPIPTNRGVWGVIEVDSRRADGFLPGEAAFVRSVAAIIGHAIDLAEAQTQLRHHVLHDRLTGLPNRTLLVDRLAQLLREARARHRYVVVAHIGLDEFSLVNDSLGHEVGDRALIEVGRRIAAVCPPHGTVARADGDEFVLIAETDDPADAAPLAKAVIGGIWEEIEVDGHELHLTASVGVAVGGDVMDPNRLLVSSAAASHRASERGGGTFEVFDDDLRDRLLQRVQLDAEIRRGLRDGEFRPWYQPIVAVADGRIVGAEALARWEHPTRGIVGPADFLGVAEQAGLAGELADVVLAHALEDAARWTSGASGDQPKISVNVAASELVDGRVVETLRREIGRTGIDPARICVEIVEGRIPDELTEQVCRTMREIKALGPIRISIDDFGTGHSSLSRLHALPVDTLKIDRSFIAKLTSGERDRSIVAAIVQMAQALGLETIAEGVEERTQWELLRQLGCDYAQGWHFSKAVPAAELLRMPLAPDW